MLLLCCMCFGLSLLFFFFFKQKTAYEMRISDWSSDVCSSDLDRSYVIYVWFCVRFEVEWRTQIAYVAFMSDLEIIRQRGGIRPLARKLGHRNHTTVQGWWVRDRIPPRHRDTVLAIPATPSSQEKQA